MLRKIFSCLNQSNCMEGHQRTVWWKCVHWNVSRINISIHLGSKYSALTLTNWTKNQEMLSSVTYSSEWTLTHSHRAVMCLKTIRRVWKTVSSISALSPSLAMNNNPQPSPHTPPSTWNYCHCWVCPSMSQHSNPSQFRIRRHSTLSSRNLSPSSTIAPGIRRTKS